MGNEQGKPISDEEVRQREIQKMDADMSRRMARGVDWNCSYLVLLSAFTSNMWCFSRKSFGNAVSAAVPRPMILLWNAFNSNRSDAAM
jgi:hypothetical protein